jgi:hypothetical protein
MARKKVSFWAKKPITSKVMFYSNGKKITFYAMKPKKTKVEFYAKRKRR